MNPTNEHKSEPVASHSCTDGNSIEQIAREVAIDYFTQMGLWALGHVDEKGDLVEGNTTWPIVRCLKEAQLKLETPEGKQTVYFFQKRLKSMLINDLNDERIVTQQTINQGTEAGIQKL